MEKFKHLGREKVFSNNIIDVYEEKLLLPNGNEVKWTFTEKAEPVGILGVIDNKAILVKQYRPAIKKETLEIPAGLIEKDELPIDAARREFEEETGYFAKKITEICTYYSSPGITSGKYYLFYAEDLEKSSQKLDENEFVEIELLDLDNLDIYKLEDPKTIIALSYYKNNILKK